MPGPNRWPSGGCYFLEHHVRLTVDEARVRAMAACNGMMALQLTLAQPAGEVPGKGAPKGPAPGELILRVGGVSQTVGAANGLCT